MNTPHWNKPYSFTWNKIAKVHLPGGRAERTIHTLKKAHGENFLFLLSNTVVSKQAGALSPLHGS